MLKNEIMEIDEMKSDSKKLNEFIKNNSNGTLINFLNRLGKLPKNFDKDSLILLTKNESDKVRYLAIKNLAKLSDFSLIDLYINKIENDSSSNVRRESVSAIGRLRNKNSIPFLKRFLDDSDPEIAMQAIRGLLVFKDDNEIKMVLKKLEDHPNEIIRQVIHKEFKEEDSDENKIPHSQSPNLMKNVVAHGDVLDIMKNVPDESIHLTFTSPPYYNARDYSIYRSYDDYLQFLEQTFKEVYRITKEGRFFILNTSPIIIPRVSRSHSSKRYPIPYDLHSILVKMGWEFIDDIVWVKSEASVKNRNAGFLQHRKPLAYKPNARSECVMVYRKKTDKLIDWNIKQYDKKIVEKSKIKGSYETSNIWNIETTFDKTHSAVFPKELCDRVIRFYSFIGDLIFDPFAGSGTVGKSALGLNRYFFLTEIKKEYIDRIKENLGSNIVLTENYKKPTFLSMKDFASLAKNDNNSN